MLILHKPGKRAILGLISDKSLLEIFKVFMFLRSSIELGNSLILLLWRSKTEMLGAFSRLWSSSIKLKAKFKVSSFLD